MSLIYLIFINLPLLTGRQIRWFYIHRFCETFTCFVFSLLTCKWQKWHSLPLPYASSSAQQQKKNTANNTTKQTTNGGSGLGTRGSKKSDGDGLGDGDGEIIMSMSS